MNIYRNNSLYRQRGQATSSATLNSVIPLSITKNHEIKKKIFSTVFP